MAPGRVLFQLVLYFQDVDEALAVPVGLDALASWQRFSD
ncbi:hypothetical protein X474_06690 [Dethiosulfatarculus sandiegensis]|uniref:Uncharacterized protein n=1 Tax=Dethiosulfatarculus sandiegensis TaxID=1429043 RepID=A0A0D2GJ43_9BACT|nr:hypothetical protein X474_06690 [Dethiosulfatarculus sandiegensis]